MAQLFKFGDLLVDTHPKDILVSVPSTETNVIMGRQTLHGRGGLSQDSLR